MGKERSCVVSMSQCIGIAAVSVAFLVILTAVCAACVALFIEGRRPYPDDDSVQSKGPSARSDKQSISGNLAGK